MQSGLGIGRSYTRPKVSSSIPGLGVVDAHRHSVLFDSQ